MHSYLKDLAYACVGLGAVFCIPALLMPARGRDRQEQRRHSRGPASARPRGEGWPDLRTCLTVMAIGASLLADQSTGDRVRLLLAVPVFAVLIWNVVSWLASRARRRSGRQQPAGAGYEAARYRGDPRYPADSRQPTDSRYPADPRYRADSRYPADPRHRPERGSPGGPQYPANLPYRHARSSPARRRDPGPPGSGGAPDS